MRADEVRVALLAACRIGDRTLQRHIADLQTARTDPDQARWMLARLQAARHEARAALTAALDPSWWDQATPEALETTYQAARVWSHTDPVCAELEECFAAIIRIRYQVSVDAIAPNRSSHPTGRDGVDLPAAVTG